MKVGVYPLGGARGFDSEPIHRLSPRRSSQPGRIPVCNSFHGRPRVLTHHRYRQAQAGDLFLGAYIPNANGRELVGYVCATLSPSMSLTHESMATHVPGSASVCIHSVCVAKNHRRKQIALNLLKEYISRLETARTAGKPYERVLLITHELLRQLYERAGFEWAGKSNVVHGSEPWYEMRKELSSGTQTAAEPEAQQMPAGLWDALQQTSTRTRPSARPFTDFQGKINDVIRPDSDDYTISVNKFDLLCPRSGCGSIILKAGVGKWVERGSVQVRVLAHSFVVSSYRHVCRWSLKGIQYTPICLLCLFPRRQPIGGSSHHHRWSSRTSGFLGPSSNNPPPVSALYCFRHLSNPFRQHRR